MSEREAEELARTFVVRLSKKDWWRLRTLERTGQPIILVFAPWSKEFGEGASTTIRVTFGKKREGDDAGIV